MPDPLVNARIRAQRFWYRDGLMDIYLGIIILLQNGLTLLMHLGSEKSSWYWPVIWIYLLLFLVFATCGRRIMTALRQRIVYPRIGYVDPGESGYKLRIAIVALTILVIVAIFLGRCYAGWDLAPGIQWIPVLVGFIFGVLGMYVALCYGVLRHLWVGLFSLVLGFAINVEYPTTLGAELWFIAVGCAWLFSGGVAVRNFVRSTPLSAEVK